MSRQSFLEFSFFEKASCHSLLFTWAVPEGVLRCGRRGPRGPRVEAVVVEKSGRQKRSRKKGAIEKWIYPGFHHVLRWTGHVSVRTSTRGALKCYSTPRLFRRCRENTLPVGKTIEKDQKIIRQKQFGKVSKLGFTHEEEKKCIFAKTCRVELGEMGLMGSGSWFRGIRLVNRLKT